MMKSRLMKRRPRLVPPDNYQASNENLWVDEKDSDLTSISSRSSSSSEESEDEESLVTEEYADETEYHEDEEEEDSEDDDEDDEDSHMERSVDLSRAEHTEKTEEEDETSVAKFNEVTPLFKAIDSEDWDDVITFLETGSWSWKLSSLCANFYNVSEKAAASQVRTWVSARKTNGEGHITRLPLHAAIMKGAPYKVISVLLKSYSKAAKSPDSDGNYPLHLCFSRGQDIDTTTMLVREFDEAINIPNHKGLYPAECGSGRGVNELIRLCVDATRNHVESELTKEKGNLEEDRKQLLEVTKELMHLKKVVAERERNMTKENFLHQKQNLSSAISQLTKLKNDLDKHEDNLLKHHLAAEKKRMEGVMGELKKTKGELELVKAEKGQSVSGTESWAMASLEQTPAPAQHQPKEKKKKSKRPKKPTASKESTPKESELQQKTEEPISEPEPELQTSGPEEQKKTAEEDLEELQKEKETAARAIKELLQSSSRLQSNESSSKEPWTQESMIVTGIDTAMDDSRDPDDVIPEPKASQSNVSSQDKLNGAQSPKKLKNVAARFKKKMHWRKEKNVAEAE